MMSALMHRFAGLAVVPLAAIGLLAGPGGTGTGTGTAAVVGHLAYLTNPDASGQHNKVELVTVYADGSTSAPQQIGPVTTGGGWTVSIYPYGFVASTDGTQLAWVEGLTRGAGDSLQFRTVLVLRNETTGATTTLRTGSQPVGFAGDRLIVANGGPAHELVTTPSPHLVKLHVGSFPLTTYAHGVVSAPAKYPHPKGSDARIEHLELRSFGGAVVHLHSYRLAPANYRDVDAAWLSADGNQLVVERGNHQDFGGLGPSSLADEFGPAGASARRTLGHYGTAKAAWRIQSVAFVGRHDEVWAAWTRQARHGVQRVVARHVAGHWRLVRNDAVAVSAYGGYALVQPGAYVAVGSQGGPNYITRATAPAVLMRGGHSVALDIRGTGFAWLSQ